MTGDGGGDVAATGWSYAGASATGPAEWAKLSPDFQACGGPNQSPIDVPLELAGSSTSLGLELGVLPLEASSDGKGVRLGGAATMALVLGSERATLDHLALHSPAEHLLGGTRADVELEMVFSRSGEPSAIVSLLLRVGQPNPAIGTLVGALPKAGSYESKFLGATLPLAELVPKDAAILAYDGSFTTPPCASALRLVVAQVLELSPEQLASLKGAIGGDNARPVQPLGERKITLHHFGSPAPAHSGPPAPAPSTKN